MLQDLQTDRAAAIPGRIRHSPYVNSEEAKKRPEAYSLAYVEPLSAARTPLADFVNSLLTGFCHVARRSEPSGVAQGPIDAEIVSLAGVNIDFFSRGRPAELL